MKMPGIYQIQSKIKPERIYIGSAINYKKRWLNHLSELRKNKHHSLKLQHHYNKYGEEDLVFIIIEPCLPQFLVIREQHYINLYNPWFNIAQIAGSPLGIKRSEESNKKNSESHKNKYPSIETRIKLSESRLGEKNGMFGKHHLKESNKRNSEAHKGQKAWNKGKKTGIIPGNKGKKESEETKQKKRDAWVKRKLKILA